MAPEAVTNPGSDQARAESVPVIPLPCAKPALPPSAGRLAVCLEYMMAHLNQPLRVSTLSAMAGLSASRFFELFKNTIGDTPLNWFIRARMHWAGALLEKSNLQVKEVAWQVGYEDPFYFSRLFKSVHGLAPSDYRAQRITGTNQRGAAGQGNRPGATARPPFTT